MGSNITSPKKPPHNSIAPTTSDQFDPVENIALLKSLLHQVLKKKPVKNCTKCSHQMTDLEAHPKIWISKWIDYSDKYGFGYQLSNESVGVMFNDTTKLILLPNGIDVHYVDVNGRISFMTIDNYPKEFKIKIKQLSYFNRFMKENLTKAGASEVIPGKSSLSKVPHLHMWWRSTSGVFMQLNNGMLQMNCSDHTKVIVCPKMAAVTYIDENRLFTTHSFTELEKNGCYIDLYEKLQSIFDNLSLLIEDSKRAK